MMRPRTMIIACTAFLALHAACTLAVAASSGASNAVAIIPEAPATTPAPTPNEGGFVDESSAWSAHTFVDATQAPAAAPERRRGHGQGVIALGPPGGAVPDAGPADTADTADKDDSSGSNWIEIGREDPVPVGAHVRVDFSSDAVAGVVGNLRKELKAADEGGNER